MRGLSVGYGPVALLFVGIFLYLLLIGPFSAYMNAKPIEEKLGYVPSAQVIRPFAAGMEEFSAAALVAKVIMYFGGLSETRANRVKHPPDYVGIERLLSSALVLDPYNMDAYYFAQAFLVWDAREVKKANALLDTGMKYRTWDWYLPFFAGFNSAYFLKDYKQAATYYKRAADLTGEKLFIGLAGRYMQEAGQTEMAIDYLKAMVATARGELAKKTYAIRLEAFEQVLQIEQAVKRFFSDQKRFPTAIDELLMHDYLPAIPRDPYGGTFSLSENGQVKTTSKFAFGTHTRQKNKTE